MRGALRRGQLAGAVGVVNMPTAPHPARWLGLLFHATAVPIVACTIHHNFSHHGDGTVASLPLPAGGSSSAPPPPAYHALDDMLKLMPDQIELMRKLLNISSNSTAAVDARVQSLIVLQELVEDLDKAEDFRKLDGFAPILMLVDSLEDVRIAEASAWVIGTAAQNQLELQLHMIELGALDVPGAMLL